MSISGRDLLKGDKNMGYRQLLNQYNYGDIEVENLNINYYEKDYGKSIEDLLHIIKDFDINIYKHCIRVGLISLDISNKIGCDKSIQTEVYFGGLVHDIGKIMIPHNILYKPGKLTDEEFEIIKTHTIIGAGYVFDKLPYNIIRIIRDHHEKLDGSGYPRKINKNDINFQTRIVSIADIIDGYSSDRPYHTEKSHEETMKYLKNENGLDQIITSYLIGDDDFHFKRIQRDLDSKEQYE